MENMRLRCHFSIIIESIWQFWVVILFALLNQIDTIIEVIRDIGDGGFRELIHSGGIWGLVAVLTATIIGLCFQFFRWRKTWISLEDNLIILERNTLNKYKNTIAIENISSVNMERNLFERLVGTYRIKLDTNSMTTANQTDISIVFREDIAIAFRKAVLSKMTILKGGTPQADLSEERQPDQLFKTAVDEGKKVYHSSPKEMVKHAIYTLPISSLLISIAGIGFSTWYIGTFGLRSFVEDTMGGFMAVAILVVSATYSLVKRFITYYDFTVYRDGKDIHVRCGLIKLKSYTVPVDKISALSIEQPLMSRIFRRYNVKVVTVGLGDEDGESSNITMSLSRAELKERLAELVPECHWADLDQVEPEDRGGIFVRFVKAIKWQILTATAVLILWQVVHVSLWVMLIPVAMDLFIILLYILSHVTAGYLIKEEGIVMASGFFTKRYTLCSYKKVQIMRLTFHPAAKLKGLGAGVIDLLNSAAEIPYMKADKAYEISNKIIGGAK